ncbi:hypothetical protein AA313_de0204699 [Arthrobotrys entomopaga]|nr:hypothetical protein AA313_de0204699 [Arthrobotrys entomopaga]
MSSIASHLREFKRWIDDWKDGVTEEVLFQELVSINELVSEAHSISGPKHGDTWHFGCFLDFYRDQIQRLKTIDNRIQEIIELSAHYRSHGNITPLLEELRDDLQARALNLLHEAAFGTLYSEFSEEANAEI